MSEAKELKFLNAFNVIPGVGSATLRLLKNHFGSYEAAWSAGNSAFSEIGITRPALQAILWKKPSLHPDRELQRLIQENIWMIDDSDPHFPNNLKEIHNAPVILYGRGDLKILSHPIAVGVVGTRRPTQYGLETTEYLVQELARAGVAIISGLASGIDTKAHETALQARGTTIAVLGSGINDMSIFPPENRGLAKRIAQSGNTMLSEYAPGTPAVKEHFPQRNRIISGLSRGILVIEARERSGALITARFALEQNRDVFAVPGSIFSATSAGPNGLIKEGAKLVQSAKDILEELGLEYTGGKSKELSEPLEETERMIYELLSEPLGVDTIKERTGFEASSIITSLSMLELKGIIKNLGQDQYQRIN